MSDDFSAVPPAPSGAPRPGDRDDTTKRRPDDTSFSILWAVLPSLLAMASGSAAWYALGRVLLEDGQPLVGPVIEGALTGGAAGFIGALVGRSVSDWGRGRGVAAGIASGLLAVVTILLGHSAVVGDEVLPDEGDLAFALLWAGFGAVLTGGWGKRPMRGAGRSVAIVGMVLLLGASLGVAALAGDVDAGPTSAERRLEARRERSECKLEKEEVSTRVRNANYESGYAGWEDHPEIAAERQKHPKGPDESPWYHAKGRYYTWAEADPGWKVVVIGDPPC